MSFFTSSYWGRGGAIIFAHGLQGATQVHTNTRLTIDGKLSVHKIVGQHVLLKNLFVEGMDWFVWKASAEILFPSLPDIAQRALNAKYSVQQGQDVFQVYLRAVCAWSNGMANGKNDPSLFITKDIWKGNPKCSLSDVKWCVEIARKFGGCGTSIVEHLRVFLGAFKKADRGVTTATLEALATLKLAPGEMCPHFTASILMTLAAAPNQNVISASEIKTIAKNANVPVMLLHESVTKTMIELADGMGVPEHIVAKEIGEFRTTITLKFFKKGRDAINGSVESIASKCFTALLAHATTKMENPWADHIDTNTDEVAEKSRPGPKTGEKTAPQVVQYQDGKVVGAHIMMLAKKGFTVDALVKHKKNGTITYELV